MVSLAGFRCARWHHSVFRASVYAPTSPQKVAEGLYATDKDVESFRRKAKVWLQNPLLDCVPGGLRPAPILHRLPPTVCAVQILGGVALAAAVLGAVTLTVAKR